VGKLEGAMYNEAADFKASEDFVERRSHQSFKLKVYPIKKKAIRKFQLFDQ